MKPPKIILVALFFTACSGQLVRYDDHQVFSIKIRNDDQLVALKNLEGIPNKFKFIDVPSAINSTVQVVIAPQLQNEFEHLVKLLQLEVSLDISDLQRIIDAERPHRRKRAVEFGWDDYRTLEEIYAWVDDLVLQYSDILTVETIGHSYEQREIKVVKLSHNPNNPGIFLDANIHAREWITSATATWILNELLTSDDPLVQNLAKNFNWYVVPVLNPDGFVFTHSMDRMWRKTRTPYSLFCYGADLNRNFDFQWNNGGTSSNPCSDNYSGPHPESELEVKTLSQYLLSISYKVTLYLSLHSAGQFVIVPFGYTNAPRPTNDAHLRQIGRRGVVDAYDKHQKPYRVGTPSEVLYTVSGSSQDWAYSVAEIPLAYTFELRPQLDYTFRFFVPADQIVETSEEILAAFIGMIDEAQVLGYF
ncbi:zinc carboxypeptidase-like [Uranotaenia lowii]|uniref:zinc carboxypeptidase-like n=1 Tax=Uranotaenia lowii TaxID=190385 RepID=UPI002478BB06|nr:zinc carboxypeptidase-like [Uranotaenia lowii]